MTLDELFVSHKLVEPVSFDAYKSDLPEPIYLNFDRALKAASGENISTWKVGNEEESPYNWKVGYSKQKNSTPSGSTFKPWNSNNEWINIMVEAYRKQGLNDNAIKNLLTKNSVESNWGTSKLSQNYNFGGITAGKYWKGKTVESGDKDKNGKNITLRFRAYNNVDDYVKDEIQFLTKLYDFDLDDTIDLFLDKLQGNNSGKRSYAEDPRYKTILKTRYSQI